MPSHAASLVDPQQRPPVEVHPLDAHALSLMESLRRPRQAPSWWGKEYAELQASARRNRGSSDLLLLFYRHPASWELPATFTAVVHSTESTGPALSCPPTCPPRPAPPLQRKCGEVLESRAAHYIIIALVLLDLGIVVTELALSSFYPEHDHAPHAGEDSGGAVLLWHWHPPVARPLPAGACNWSAGSSSAISPGGSPAAGPPPTSPRIMHCSAHG